MPSVSVHFNITPAGTAATYAEVFRRTRVALDLGEQVVLDASFGDRCWRDEAGAVAARGHADLVELRCSVPPELAAERIRQRMAVGGGPSDATPDVAAALAALADPWPQAEAIDMSAGPGEGVVSALAAVRRVRGR